MPFIMSFVLFTFRKVHYFCAFRLNRCFEKLRLLMEIILVNVHNFKLMTIWLSGLPIIRELSDF